VYLESALVERLVADAANEPGVLPLIQETLVLLWERIERRFLPLRAYDALVLPRHSYGPIEGKQRSGLSVALARHADGVVTRLDESAMAIARRTFLRLIQFNEGRADTRRRQPIQALRVADEDPELLDAVIEELVEKRLLTTSGGDGGGPRQVDIAHEALIDGWPTLQQWIAERRSAELVRRRLDAKCDEWVRLGKKSGGLLDDAEIGEAETWLANTGDVGLGASILLKELVTESRRAIDEAKARELENQRELAEAKARELAQTKKALGAAKVRNRIAWGLSQRSHFLRRSRFFRWSPHEPTRRKLYVSPS
jgi:hypothetical protein